MPQFDAIAALIIAVNLSYQGYKIFRRSTAALIDESDPLTLVHLTKAFNLTRRSGVIDIHMTKVIRSGRFHHVDCHLVVPEFWSIAEAHPFTHSFETDVIASYEGDGEVNFHMDPCYRDFCSVCDVEPCPVRQKPFVAIRPLTIESITGPALRDSDRT